MAKIIARVFGGLGNQLFIYATARAMAERTGAELVLDTRTGFQGDAYERQFALHHFNANYREATALERFDFPTGRGWRYVFRRGNEILPFKNRFYLTDLLANEWFFMPEMLAYCPSSVVWLEGYWQSPRYFEDARTILDKELRIKSPLSVQTLRLAEHLQKPNSICIHLRMLRNVIKGVEALKVSETNMKYYQRSMDYIAERLENPQFFCFSDNPEISNSLLQTPYNLTFVKHNKSDEHAYEDFYLMTLCRHFILSNSTFGWWAAWMGQANKSMVMSPPLHRWDNRDILPQGWKTTD